MAQAWPPPIIRPVTNIAMVRRGFIDSSQNALTEEFYSKSRAKHLMLWCSWPTYTLFLQLIQPFNEIFVIVLILTGSCFPISVFDMRIGFHKLARLIIAISVTFLIAAMPILSQRAAASSQSIDKIPAVLVAGPAKQTDQVGSCEQKSDSETGREQAKCCEIGCSSFAPIDLEFRLSLVGYGESYFLVEARLLSPRTNFGLERPPRV